MSADDKAKGKAEEVTGKAKKATGGAVGNERLEAEGRSQEATGAGRQSVEKIKDTFRGLFKRH